jgi:pyridoxal phosphate enzyme (YggS family)
MAEISEQVKKLFGEIETICARCGRKAGEITVVAATKYASTGQINDAIKAGITVIGENKVQDAGKKFPHLLPVKKHFIGHLQTNKVKEAVRLFDCVESVDSYRLAEMINIEAERSLKRIPIYIEVNIAGDPKKHGIEAGELHHFIHKLLILKWLEIKGLMAIVPLADGPEEVRVHFKKMKGLFDSCAKVWPQINVLSMGMTQDFKVAIEEGATEVRIGSYLFR